MKLRYALPSLALTLLTISAPAAPQDIVQPPLRHEVSVRLVLVDLAAVDKDGHFVPGGRSSSALLINQTFDPSFEKMSATKRVIAASAVNRPQLSQVKAGMGTPHER